MLLPILSPAGNHDDCCHRTGKSSRGMTLLGESYISLLFQSLTAIMLFLLLLAAMNTQEIASVAEAELEAMEIDWSSELEDKLGLPFYYLNNERKMMTGQHLVSSKYSAH